MPRRWLNLTGVAVLLVGFACVLVIEHNIRTYEAGQLNESAETEDLIHPEDSRQYVRNAEMMNGKFVMIVEGMWDSVAGLGHSRGFAVGVAVASVAGAALLFGAANYSSRE